MSDGPHRSLKMSKVWKRLAEICEQAATPPQEVAEQLKLALAENWKTVPQAAIDEIERILNSPQPSLFGITPDSFDAVLPLLDGSPVGIRLVENAQEVASEGMSGEAAFREAIHRAVEEDLARHSRQVTEHYIRKGPKALADSVTARIGAAGAVIEALSSEISQNGRPARIIKPSKRRELDDGVPL